jgi:hypothetical protein
MKHPLDYGNATSDTLLRELAEEAERYLAMLKKLESLPEGEERDDLEGALYASISHFKAHSEVTLECLDELVAALPEEEAYA